MKLLIISIFCLSLGLGFVSCNNEEDPVKEMIISEDFKVEGKWNFIKVSGDGVLFGIPTSSTDDEPMGYVEFFEDFTGYADFSVNLLDNDFTEQQDFNWVRTAVNEIVLNKSDGKVDTWHIVNANNQAVEAEWDISIAGNTATVKAMMEK